MTSVATDRAELRAVTRPLPALDDLLAARGPGGFAWLYEAQGFVTTGTVAVVAADRAEAVLATIDVDDPLQLPGTGPLAVGALGFEPAAPGHLVIPSTVIGRTPDGQGWITQVGDAGGPLHVPGEPLAPSRWRVEAGTDRATWRAWVEEALDLIDRGGLDKVVLARALRVETDEPLSASLLLARLRDQQPGCFVHHADGWLGASPELLVRRIGSDVESRPMAGTARVGTVAFDGLDASRKDQREHRFVVDHVADALTPECEWLDVPERPVTCAFSSVAHLTTRIRGRLRPTMPSALTLARRLHPTPAVAGTPVDEALRTIARLESGGRGRYAGPVGWVDRRGDGEWALALRGAQIDGSSAVLHAGAGIVAGSDPDGEWAEIDTKFEPMLRAIAGSSGRLDASLIGRS